MLMWFVIYPLLPICYVHMYICVCVGRGVVVFWIMCHLYQLLQFLNNVIIIKARLLFPQTYVTLDLIG
jgi:hypothetical protein